MSNQAQQDSNKAFEVPAEVEAELRAQAAADVAKSFDKEALLEKFRAEAREKALADLRAQAAAEAVDEEGTKIDGHGFPKKYFEILIYKGTEKGSQTYATLGVNGIAWKVVRGEKVIVPSVVVEALNHAVSEHTTQEDGGLVMQAAHRFPFQLIREANEDEYKSFMDQMRAHGKTVARV